MTGAIRVSDGSVGYDAQLTGDWSAQQVRAAFADGYDWREDSSGFVMVIWDESGQEVDALPVEAGRDYGDYPHAVKWAD